MSPIRLNGTNWDWSDDTYQKLSANAIHKLRSNLALCDGGLYDNMGLEILWKHGKEKKYQTVFSCDAGAPFSIPWYSHWKLLYNWIGQFTRMSDIMINQQRALRKRILIRNFLEKEYTGSYWSIENGVIPLEGKAIKSLISKADFKNMNT